MLRLGKGTCDNFKLVTTLSETGAEQAKAGLCRTNRGGSVFGKRGVGDNVGST